RPRESFGGKNPAIAARPRLPAAKCHWPNRLPVFPIRSAARRDACSRTIAAGRLQLEYRREACRLIEDSRRQTRRASRVAQSKKAVETTALWFSFFSHSHATPNSDMHHNKRSRL